MVSFEEAQEYGESQQRRVEAYLAKSVSLGRVAERELAEINRIRDAFLARLNDQPDPWVEFRKHQSRLLALALERHGTDEGVRAYAAYLANEAHPRPVGEAEGV